MSRATLTGPMMMNLSAFQHAHSTMRWSQPGPPSAAEPEQMLAIRMYGSATSVAGIPHLSPRRVRMAATNYQLTRPEDAAKAGT